MFNIEGKIRRVAGDEDRFMKRVSKTKFVENVRVLTRANCYHRISPKYLAPHLLDYHASLKDVVSAPNASLYIASGCDNRFVEPVQFGNKRHH